LNTLRRYYSLNVPPILLVEILGDLHKTEDVVASRVEVQRLADKIVPACSAVNVNYRALIAGEIAGHKIDIRGVPALGGGVMATRRRGRRRRVFLLLVPKVGLWERTLVGRNSIARMGGE